MNIKVISTWKFETKALCDYIADAVIYYDDGDEYSNVLIGFCDFFGDIEPTHVFIKAGLTKNGDYINAETIETKGTIREIEIDNRINGDLDIWVI